jgi:hypothetical protein
MTEGSRNVGDRAQDTLDKAGEHARSTADDAADSTKSTYNKIKSSIGSFLGGAKHPDDKCACGTLCGYGCMQRLCSFLHDPGAVSVSQARVQKRGVPHVQACPRRRA